MRARTSVEPPAKVSGPPEADARRPRAARSSGGKDRHSKVNTAKGPRDRRVRLSVPTAVQFYDVQDRLGFDQPSKAVEWLIKHAKAAIDELAHLPPVRQPGDPPAAPDLPISAPAYPATLPVPRDSSSASFDHHAAAAFTVEGMALPAGGPAFGQAPVDPDPAMFRTSSDPAGASARVESRAKARERARERAKEKHYDAPAPPARYSPAYAALPSQVSSALQHPFQAPLHQHQRQPYASTYNYPEAFSYGYQSAPPYEPSPSSLPSVSHYFVENPPGALGGRYGSAANPSFPGFAPGPPAAPSLRGGSGSSFSGLLGEPGQYSGFPSQSYYPYSAAQARPPSSSLLGNPPGSRVPPQGGSGYPPSPHLVRPGHDRQHPGVHSGSTPHSLDPNFYNPQIPTRLQGFEELEEEFKP